MENVIPELKNDAIKINDELAPFLLPMPSSQESLIKAAVEFALELDPRQSRRLTQMSILSHHPKLKPLQKKALELRIDEYIRRKRFHTAKDFVQDIIKSLSWREFADQNQMAGKVDKVNMGQ